MCSRPDVSQVCGERQRGEVWVTVTVLDDRQRRRQFAEVPTLTDTAESLSLMLQNHHLLALLWTLPLDSSLMLLVLHCLLEHACEATINISRAKPELLEARSVYLTAYFGRSVKYCEN